MNDIKLEKPIKLVALDLDRTTLNSIAEMSDHTAATLERALAAGVHVVAATGRGMHTIPESFRGLKGIRYFVTANGAKVYDLEKEDFILSLSIPKEKTLEILDLLKDIPYFAETFKDGRAYVDQRDFDAAIRGEVDYRSAWYIKNTRNPVPNLFEFAEENAGSLEAFNIVFPDVETREAYSDLFLGLQDVSVTSSFHINWEIMANGVGKGTTTLWLAEELGLEKANIMACGDGANDRNLLECAGLAVAMENADEELKEIADYITASCEEDGVAKAVEKFVFGE